MMQNEQDVVLHFQWPEHQTMGIAGPCSKQQISNVLDSQHDGGIVPSSTEEGSTEVRLVQQRQEKGAAISVALTMVALRYNLQQKIRFLAAHISRAPYSVATKLKVIDC